MSEVIEKACGKARNPGRAIGHGRRRRATHTRNVENHDRRRTRLLGAQREARGIRVVATTRELEDAIADVVISNHALEHTLAPLDELREPVGRR